MAKSGRSSPSPRTKTQKTPAAQREKHIHKEQTPSVKQEKHIHKEQTPSVKQEKPKSSNVQETDKSNVTSNIVTGVITGVVTSSMLHSGRDEIRFRNEKVNNSFQCLDNLEKYQKCMSHNKYDNNMCLEFKDLLDNYKCEY
jgi:hypothetical protein